MSERIEALRAIERAALRAWPSEESVVYDGWVLRASRGYTKRANSVNPHFGSSRPLEEKLEHCRTFYAARNLPTIYRLTPFSSPVELDRRLEEAGFTTLDRTLVMTSPLNRERSIHRTGSGGAPRRAALNEWLAAFDRLKDLDDAERAPHRHIVESAEGRRFCALIEREGEPIACGLAILIDNLVGLFDLWTAEAHRRQGHASAIVAQLLEWSAEAGAREAFLQVHSQNESAQQLYERFAFTVAYPYWYRIEPEAVNS